MAFESTRIEGALLSADLVEAVIKGEAPGQSVRDFGLPPRSVLTDEVAYAWGLARAHWDAFQHARGRLAEKAKSGADSNPQRTPLVTKETRTQWVEPLLASLGYDDLARASEPQEVGDRIYPISHYAGSDSGAPPVHIVGAGQDLDRPADTGRPRMSPHALVQEYLNRTEHVWGLVTNGLLLRVLRDSVLMSRPAYIEFDLAQIFDGEKFAEFAVFFRLAHRTRLPKETADAHECLLERYFQQSIEEGGRIRDKLRDGVEAALIVLGNGFLRHPANATLLEAANNGTLDPQSYYRELLNLVYRLLFLMVAEDRRLVGPTDEHRSTYDEYYSVGRLRRMAIRRTGSSRRHTDLWDGLVATFRLFSEGEIAKRLGVKPLNGGLFGDMSESLFESTKLYNTDILDAVRHLSIYRADGGMRRVNYGALDVEELGSVYESLLDFQPIFTGEPSRASFELSTGTERKSTGSYYTRPDLVRQLIKSALVPVIEDRLKGLKDPRLREQALLSIKVCDPASGSGHFLVAAARRIAASLAEVRTGEEHPSPQAFRQAVRDVIRHCIYGVDLNPLAVDLCKVALWIEGHHHDLPLSFLDNHIKCGNSLVGVFDLGVLREGIPDEAFKPLTGDDKEAAKQLMRRNRQAREARDQFDIPFYRTIDEDLEALAQAVREIDTIDEESTDDVRRKEALFEQTRSAGSQWWIDWTACNLWTYAFFAPKKSGTDRTIPATDRLSDYLGQPNAAHGELIGRANGYAQKQRFFHWPLEFADVFEQGGFDVVLGNPPWEMLQLNPIEFFSIDAPEIASASNMATRNRLIGELATTQPALYGKYLAEQYATESKQKFIHESKRFPLTSFGRINLAPLFVELALGLVRPPGRAGMLVPTGIATDAFNQRFFGTIVAQNELVSLYDFENRNALFPGVHRSYKFCLLTLRSTDPEAAAGKSSAGPAQVRLAFFLQEVADLESELAYDLKSRNPVRVFELSTDDFARFNPNTQTCPVFRTTVDAELSRKIYERIPVMMNHRESLNPWGFQGLLMFMMNTDSGLFRNEPGRGLVPLCEAKMIHQFDHRWATYEGQGRTVRVRDVTVDEKRDPRFVVHPRYWVEEAEVEARLRDRWDRRWLVAYRRIARATDERTMVAVVLPRVGCGDPCPVVLSSVEAGRMLVALTANLNSLVLDYVTRQKVAGIHLDFFVVKQLSVLPPDAFGRYECDFIVPRALELIYTAHVLRPVAEDIGYKGEPFPWDEDRRALLRAELDAFYARLYGLTREELHYILDPHDVMGEAFPGETFRVLKENEIRKYGRYRTKELVLEAWDRLDTSREHVR